MHTSRNLIGIAFVVCIIYIFIVFLVHSENGNDSQNNKDASSFQMISISSQVIDYDLESFLHIRAVNGTIMLMMTDYGYLNHFLNVYYAGNLSQYPNLIVTCIDPQSYTVLFRIHIIIILDS